MFKIIINGQKIETTENKNLLDFLRDDMDFTAVKNGCGEGACGACMVLVDGKPFRACVLTTEKVNNKNVFTVEGLNEYERDVFAYTFSDEGAVQCGFCIPGMVVSAKGLFLRTLNPTRDEVKAALRGNICRCTGYVKIEKAILESARIFREGIEVPKVECKGFVGENTVRIDAKDKTLGKGKYAEDIKVPGMVYGGAVRTQHPRALIKNIDISEAEKLDGVIGILTAKDVPGYRNIGHLSFISDWDALIAEGEITRYMGDALVLIAAKDKRTLKKAKALVKVEYEILEPITDPEKALEEGAPKIHEKGNLLFKQVLKRGDAEKAIESAKYKVTNIYTTPYTEHAYLEPESATAIPKEDGIKIITSSQSIYDEQREIARLLGMELSKVEVESTYVGGGFGGKEDMSVQHHAALLAWKFKVPVQVTLGRQESLVVSTKRHPMKIEMTTACDENGILLGMKAKIISDTGAYSSLGGPVLQRACTHAAGPYNYHNIDIEGISVYTNNPIGGAFRGFGVTQSAFATESNLNKLAEMVGISPFDIRYRNAIEPGMILPNGQIADAGTGLKETLLAVKDVYENNKLVGIACAFKNAGIGVGLPDVGRCILSIEKGKVHLRTSAACIGQGVGTIAMQMVCETTGLNPKDIVVETPSTLRTPNSGTTTASRQTVFTGEATKVAAKKLKERLMESSLKELEGEEFIGEYSGVTDPMNSEKKNPESHVAYGYATQVVILGEDGKIKKVVAAHDVGKAINPKNVEGQIEGGVVMGLGYALTEDLKIDNGVIKSKFGTLGLFRSTDVPEIESIIIEKNTEELAYGAKGVGEIVVIPTAPAIQGAYYKYDGKFRTSLPLKETAYKK
ncbi:selenium-dependent xanthine dehydrogenase [Cetobacterium sp.]|uniref:selenium-dependent xanthine dehydrogenase n=1 Tax=Cetobacterium sp. TaxID=2071632 RepID=UPI002FC90434